MSSTSLISAQNISVSRQRKLILDHVSLDIEPNDFLTIIGPNGAGKSMLLKCLLGFYEPDQGQIIQKPNLRIGYVPQRLVADRSVPITVRRFLALRKKTSKEELARIVEDCDIHTQLDKQLNVLSGGELQRVLLARALLDQPELLILDEPAQNLDINGQLAFYKRLDHIFTQRDISVLMVSHDLHLVLSSTQRVVCLYHHICCTGAPATITKDPAFVNLFGNDMADLMAVYNHDHNHRHDHAHDHAQYNETTDTSHQPFSDAASQIIAPLEDKGGHHD